MPSGGMTCADIVDEPLRREAVFGRPRRRCGSRIRFAQMQEAPGAFGSLPSIAIGQRLQRGADIADDFGLREIDLLDSRRLIADMNDLRAALAHDERRLLDGVMADRDDEVGLFDRLVDIVPLRQRGGAHIEFGSAGNGPLAHLGREERNAGSEHELREIRCRARTRGRRPRASASGRLAAHDQLRGAIERRVACRRQLDRMRRQSAAPSRILRPRYLPAVPDAPGPGRSSCAMRNASRTMVGIICGETICRESLVSGFIDATTSTIWKRACRDDRIPFCPVIIIIGIAPRRHRPHRSRDSERRARAW